MNNLNLTQKVTVVYYPGYDGIPLSDYPVETMTVEEYELRSSLPIGSKGSLGCHWVEYATPDEPEDVPTPENTMNLTPHEIVFVDGEIETKFPASGLSVRCDEESTKTKSGKFCRKKTGLPILIENETKKPATQNISGKSFYIVSRVALEAIKKLLPDKCFISPDTGTGAIRNEKGQITGTRCWVLAIEE